MFTGIVNHCGVLLEVSEKANGMRLNIQSQFEQFVIGESIAVDGICLTVTHAGKNNFYCDISPETCAVTSAKYFKVAQSVNLERALKVGDSLGGHWVSGHVDQTAKVDILAPQGDFCLMHFILQHKDAMKYLIDKGSITVNGVSLTINKTDAQGFSVMLIPETLARTNLKQLEKNSVVNIEMDGMSKIITRQCEAWLQKNLVR